MQKVAHYRRALWTGKTEGNVEDLLREALLGAPSVADTKFEYADSIFAQIAKRDTAGTDIALYFTLFDEGGTTGTVQNGGEQIGRAKPPTGTEFLKSGIHIVIEGNNLAYVASGHTNDGQLTHLIAKFLQAKKISKSQTQFIFGPKANRNELQRLLKNGVKEIDLGVNSLLSEAERLNEAATHKGISTKTKEVLKLISGIFSKDKTIDQIEAASTIEASLSLTYDGRRQNALSPKLLTDIAQAIDHDRPGFKIRTRDGTVITHDKLAIRREISVVGDEISLTPESTFPKLRESLAIWRKNGTLT